MQKKYYDIIIIGAGSGGLNVASFFSRINLRVLLIDKKDEAIGGDCLHTGCIPSKALIHVANQIYEGKLSNRFMKDSTTSHVDIKKVTEYIVSKQESIRAHENKEYLQHKGIEYLSGVVKFIDTRTVNVDGTFFVAKNFVIATGSRARKLSIQNDGSLPVYTNETIFTIDILPKHFIFIGGGPINCELGQAFSRLGSKVTILHSGERILEKEIPSVSSLLLDSFTEEGITVVTNVHLQKISDKKVFYTIEGDAMTKELSGDAIFVGIGRELNIEGLDLEKAKVFRDDSKTKLIVDEYLRTSNHNIYVVGDVAGNYQFTHAAEMHAKVVINNMLSFYKKKFNAAHIAWVTYTTPEIATFGIPQEKAISSGCEVVAQDFIHEDRAIVDENQQGRLVLYVTKKGLIKGGTMIAKNAGETSQEIILAMSTKIPLSKLFAKVYPYPTASRINKTIAGVWESRKLTNFTRKVLQILYKIR